MPRTLVASDDFNRASLGTTDWGQLNSGNRGSIVINSSIRMAGEFGPAGTAIADAQAAVARRITGTFSNDQYSKLTLLNPLALNGNTYHIGVVVRASGDVDNARDYYELSVFLDDGSTPTWALRKVVNGAVTVLHSAAVATAANDTISLEVEGTTLRAYKNDVALGGSFTQTDTSLSTGRPGVTSCAGTFGDSWEGGDVVADGTAPTLSSPSGTTTGTTTATGGVTTNEANGTLYAVVTTSATAPTAAQIRAGQDHTGASAAWAGNQAVTTTGAKTFNATALTPSTTYYFHFHHRDAANNDSAVQTSASFTTNAAGSAPSISVQPANTTVLAGATATFSVTASGTSLTYQWQRSTNGGSSWSNISGATSASYTTPATALTGGSANSGDQYRVVVTGSIAPAVTSSAATLTVQTVPAVVTHPSPASVVTSNTATFSATFSGSPTPTYQWQRSVNGGSTWSDISGATSSSYTTGPTTVTGGSANNNDLFRCVATNAAGSVTTNPALLTVTAAAVAPGVNTNPSNATVSVGSTATFSASFSGTPAPTLQWQVSTDGGGTYSNIAGATSASYTTPTLTGADSGKRYRCVATNSAGTATTTAAVLTVNSFSVTAGPFFRNTGDAAPITEVLSYSLIFSTIGAYAGYTPLDGTTTPHPSTGLVTITGLPVSGPADLLLRNADGSAIGYQRVTAA